MAARSPSGEVRAYPASRNHHENQILEWSVLPANVPRELEIAAEALAEALITKLDMVGLLCAELFVTTDGELFVNELAPRPHNSYHQSERGCETSQFEQLVRAVCNLPLGSTEIVAPAAIANLLGDLWLNGQPNFAAALEVQGVRLHLYEKHTPRVGRKMGHLSATGRPLRKRWSECWKRSGGCELVSCAPRVAEDVARKTYAGSAESYRTLMNSIFPSTGIE